MNRGNREEDRYDPRNYNHCYLIVSAHAETWKQNFNRLARDAARIIMNSTVPLQRRAIEDAETGGDSPCANEVEGIRFNAKGSDCPYSDFELTVDKAGRNSIKTQRDPYNAIVCAVLIRTKVVMGDAFYMRSSGFWDNDPHWIEAKALNERYWPEDKLTAARMGLDIHAAQTPTRELATRKRAPTWTSTLKHALKIGGVEGKKGGV